MGLKFDVYAAVAAIEERAAQSMLSEAEAHERIGAAIRLGGPFLLGRPGSFEAKLTNEYLDFRQHRIRPRPYGSNRQLKTESSGDFPLRTPDELDVFASDYVAAVVQSDLLVVWRSAVIGSGELLRRSQGFVNLGHIEPILALANGVTPWSHALEGRRVLVVHPFARSIMSQYSRREAIPILRRMLPPCHIEVLVPPQTYAGMPVDERLTWSDHLQRAREEVADREFDVAIIGAGPYGLPIGAFVKQLGKPAIHLGGATQLLFAIRGGRWDSREPFGSLMDDAWVRPLPEETPPRAATYEHGSPYW